MKLKKRVVKESVDPITDLDSIAEAIAKDIEEQAEMDMVPVIDTDEFYEWLYEEYDMNEEIASYIPRYHEWHVSFSGVGMLYVYLESKLRDAIVESIDPEVLPRSMKRFAHMIKDMNFWSEEGNQYDILLEEGYLNYDGGRQIFGYGVRDTVNQLKQVYLLDTSELSDQDLIDLGFYSLVDKRYEEQEEDEIGSSSLYEYRM